jgi:hypothetical protein
VFIAFINCPGKVESDISNISFPLVCFDKAFKEIKLLLSGVNDKAFIVYARFYLLAPQVVYIRLFAIE